MAEKDSGEIGLVEKSKSTAGTEVIGQQIGIWGLDKLQWTM